MVDLNNLPDVETDPLAKYLEILKVQFRTSLQEKERDVEDVIGHIVAHGLSMPVASRLYYLSHNLVGVAPTHGFKRLGAIAKKTEQLLAKSVLPPHAEISEDAVLVSADELAEEMRATLG